MIEDNGPSQEQIANARAREIESTRWPQSLHHLQIDGVQETPNEFAFRTGDAVPERVISLNYLKPFLSRRGESLW